MEFRSRQALVLFIQLEVAQEILALVTIMHLVRGHNSVSVQEHISVLGYVFWK